MNRLPLRHIVCPMDLSPLSMNALSWANAIARARSAELRAFHVVASTGLAAPRGLDFSEREEKMAKLREALVAIDPENVQTGAAVRQGDPGTQILRFAKSIPADVVVMGAAAADRPERPIGSVTAIVVARSDCPVLIVPGGREIDPSDPGRFRRILCAVDLAPSSVSVIEQALSLGWETHGLVTCAGVMTEQTPSPAEIKEQLLAAIPPEAEEWCAIDVVVKRGVPATEIVKLAQTSNADVLVIGPPRRWTSTTQAVLAQSVCPVLVTHEARPLPRPSRKDAGTAERNAASPRRHPPV
jgi:nucleotide-binding universal stress UspA family protein